jgi:acyl carrier protein
VPAETHTHKNPLTRDDVARIVVDCLAELLEVDPKEIDESARFEGDLHADSLALYQLAEDIEEEVGERTVGFRFDDDDLSELRTVAETIDYVSARVR